MRKLATLKQKVGSTLFILPKTAFVPWLLAQPEIDYTKAGFVYAISFNFSSNFSQILGTAKNTVGLAQVKLYTKVPDNASVLAK